MNSVLIWNDYLYKSSFSESRTDKDYVKCFKRKSCFVSLFSIVSLKKLLSFFCLCSSLKELLSFPCPCSIFKRTKGILFIIQTADLALCTMVTTDKGHGNETLVKYQCVSDTMSRYNLQHAVLWSSTWPIHHAWHLPTWVISAACVWVLWAMLFTTQIISNKR